MPMSQRHWNHKNPEGKSSQLTVQANAKTLEKKLRWTTPAV